MKTRKAKNGRPLPVVSTKQALIIVLEWLKFVTLQVADQAHQKVSKAHGFPIYMDQPRIRFVGQKAWAEVEPLFLDRVAALKKCRPKSAYLLQAAWDVINYDLPKIAQQIAEEDHAQRGLFYGGFVDILGRRHLPDGISDHWQGQEKAF
jgi:hypothetical protein